MVIRRSSSSDVQPLIADLLSEEAGADVRRETAVARLRVIGARAVARLLALLSPPTPVHARVAAFRALEGRREPRLADAVIAGLADPDPTVRIAALGVARGLLDGARGHEVLDRAAACALDDNEPASVRQAAIAALADLPPHTMQPLADRLSKDADPAVRAAVDRQRVVPVRDAATVIDDAAQGHLPSDPEYLSSVIADAAGGAPLPTLHRLVGVVRERERSERRPARARAWMAVRGVLHRALAERDSRVALYDLREAFESAGEALPEGFVEAVIRIGDASCLEALAAAYVRAEPVEGSAAWRDALAGAARAIVARERLTGRHAAVKRLRARHGAAAAALIG